MRKYFLALMILGLASSAQAAYLFRNSASNINSGTLNSARLDPSSVTMRGGDWSFSIDAATSSALLAYNLVVGPAGSSNVQAIVSNQESFNAILASVSARGLTTSATAQATIFFKDGIYKVQGTTVPRGITLVCGSSVVFVQTSINDRLMTIHGTVIGAKFDIGGRAFQKPQVVVSTFGKLMNCELYGGSGQPGVGVLFTACLQIGPGFDMEVKDNIVRELTSTDGLAYYGDIAPILLKDCTGFKFKDNTLYWQSQESQNSTAFSIWGATNGVINNNRFVGMLGNCFSFNTGVRDVLFFNNNIEAIGAAPDHGVFVFSSAGNKGAIVSSGVYINNNIVQLNTSNAWNVLKVTSLVAAAQVQGLVVSGNLIDGISGVGASFANLTSGSLNTVFTNNHIMTHGPTGTFLTDSGAGTKSATLGNFFNHIQQ